MRITTNNYELVHSGSIIQIENTPINIILSDKVEGDFKIVFEFSYIPNEKTVTKMSPQSKFELKIEFINFDGKQNIGTSEPLFLGTLEKKKLYLVYRISDLASLSKLIHFNFYVERR